MKLIKISLFLTLMFSAYANALTCEKITQTINSLSDTLYQLEEKGKRGSFEYREITANLRRYIQEQKKSCSLE